jgi:apolipoprotein D and lipocalin family protein
MTAYKDLPFEKNMNFTRFMGLWYNIASKPNIFEKKCKCGQTVDTLVESLVIDLSESCLILGKNVTSKSKVVASVPGYGNWTNYNGPAIADYWVVQMDPEYTWAIIGKPSRKGFWIMARDYKMEKSLLDKLIARGKELEFDLSDLEMEDQSCHTSRKMFLNENNIKTER